MLLTHLGNGESLQLPDDLLWTDEHGWTPTVAAVSYLLTGALLVETAVRQKGRPITLASPADMAWVTRATVDALHGWASEPGLRFDLTLPDARRFTVAFRHQETPLEAEPVLGIASYGAAAFFRITLRLMQI
jgi:hypothetical protein